MNFGDMDIKGIKNKDEIAFNKFYAKYHKLLFHIIFEMTNSIEDSEDLLMQVIMTVYNTIDN